MSWIAASSGTGNANVGGSNTQVQFNNGTNLAGSANLTFDVTTNTLSATNFVGNGSQLTGIIASGGTSTKTANGTSNVDIATASGNITMGVGGTAGVVTITTTGINANGYITASGNVTGSYILGNGSSLSSITGANVTGAVAYATTANSVAGANVTGAVSLATFAGTANSVAGANVTGAVSLATFAGTANAVAGANVSGEVTFAATANSVAGANVSGQVANALVAGTVYTNAQPNITSVGTLTSLAVTGNLTAGNANISGTLTVGTITTAGGGSGNISGADVITANFFSGSGNLLSNIQGANVTGAVGLATFAGTANAVAGANVSGAVAYATTANSVAGANVSGQVANALVAGTVYTNAQPNITSVGTLTSLSVTGDIGAANLTLTGNLIISGTTTSVNSTVTRVVDPLFELGGGANGAALLADDNKDRGLLLHYYSGSSTVDAFMGWDDSNGEFGVGSNVTVTNEVVTFNSYGNIRANVYFGDGSQLTGVTASGLGTFANAGLTTDELYLQATTRLNVTASGTSGYVFDQYGATVNPTIYVTSGQTIAFNLNVSSHPFLIQTGAGSNYDTGLEHVDTTGTVSTTSSAQGKISGTLYWKVPYGISGTYKYQCSAHGGMNGNIIVTDANIANITVGLATFATTANAVAGANVSGAVSFATTANSVALANVSGAGNIASINISGNASEILYGNGVFAAAPVTYSNSNVATFLASFGNNNISTTGNVAFSGANITLGSVSNLHISGGSANYVLKTDGTGNLSWTALTTTTLVVDRFTGDGAWTMQTLSATPASVDYTIVAIGGVLQPRNTYSVLAAVITFSEAPPVGAVVEITTVTGGTGGGSGGGGGAAWTYSAVSANTSAVVGYKYIVDTATANLTITLPASGTLGDEISIIDGTGNASTHAITVARNGGNIQGSASDMTVTTDRAAFTLAYYNSTQGWLLTNV